VIFYLTSGFYVDKSGVHFFKPPMVINKNKDGDLQLQTMSKRPERKEEKKKEEK
jgi:hypothetical protein